MPAKAMIEYETWDLREVELPPRSRLYNLDPVGLRTGFVESLTSYFSRLATAHSVSAGVLNHRELLPRKAGHRNMFSCAVTDKTRCFTSTINSIGNVAARFAAVVGSLTGRRDLHYLTMLPWKPVLPAQLLTRGVAGWCPQCLNRWQETGKTIYMPLLWALEVVKYCPNHHCPLQLACPFCGKPQPLLGQCCPIGYCTRCKKWLGARETRTQDPRYSLLPPESPEWEIWVAEQVKDVIGAGLHSPSLLSRAQLSRLLCVITDAEGLSGASRILGVSPTAVIAWRSGSKLPMFPAYLRIARTLNVTLTALLTGNVPPDSIEPPDVFRIPYWRSIRLRKKPPFDPHKAQRLLKEALQESPPPSMAAFRKRTGYHAWTINKHFPELCKTLCERSGQHRTLAVRKRLDDKIAEFRKIAYQLHSEGIDLFVFRVLKRMSKPRSMDYRLARDLLLDIKQEIFAQDHRSA